MTAQGFYSPTAGYWQTDDMPDQEYIYAYPDDTIAVPVRPTPNHIWQGGEWVFVEPEPEPVGLMPVTKRQLRLTLVRNGISLAQVQDAINLIPDGIQKQEAQIEWDDASSFSRTHPTLLLIASVLGLSEAQVDAMWLEAMAA